ncbi:hypothetical protein [Effusibacillus dendaii]|uniref:Outer membrane lipoprotein carrier protein LolA n=1 Tax=Effusibacillus dendaii TaxID=2743772 RepID=A0A7I8DC48_9BACL|nr:hypothetical protein [Effusibacillus dendaii]BCJ87753.1 hypothetical protein skT53_27380 [Effusibacillus dendaii]
MNKRFIAALSLGLALLMSGCSLPLSAPNSTATPAKPEEKTMDPDGWNQILDSVDKNQTVTDFGIQASLETFERNNKHAARLYGDIILPDQAVISQTIDNQSYYLYQDKKTAYYRELGVWRPTERVAIPNVWQSLLSLKKLPAPPVFRLPDLSLLTNKDTEVYQFEADAIRFADWLPTANKTIPSRYTIYVDKKTRYIRQIDIVSTSSVSDIGTMVSNASIKFFNLGNKQTKIEMPEGLKQQLKNQQLSTPSQ